MSKFTLTYFNSRGRAEISRLLFAVADVKYEDKRIEKSEWREWIKASTPFGVVPNLTFDDGTSISMSGAIANYLAREFKLYGKNNMENTQIDTITGALADIMELVYTYAFIEEAGAAKAEAKTKALARVASYGAAIEANFEQNNGGQGYLVGKGMTLADIAFFNAFSNITLVEPTALDNLPLLKDLMVRVGANEKIAKWVKTRPKTQF
ncbi:S-crystallin SL11-like [Antedon mediterranea]|uniref:S-crystallin SL11-like n=1 Tax=Antedon mediterranea TaxID=105859 RepID=UPI003AF518E0